MSVFYLRGKKGYSQPMIVRVMQDNRTHPANVEATRVEPGDEISLEIPAGGILVVTRADSDVLDLPAEPTLPPSNDDGKQPESSPAEDVDSPAGDGPAAEQGTD